MITPSYVVCSECYDNDHNVQIGKLQGYLSCKTLVYQTFNLDTEKGYIVWMCTCTHIVHGGN